MLKKIKSKKNLLLQIKEKENFVTPTKEGTKEELINLKNTIDIMIKMLDDDNVKPFDEYYANLLEKGPYCDTFKKTLLCVLYNKAMNILENHKKHFTTGFELYYDNHSITIYAKVKEICLPVFYLDISEDKPELTSITYDFDVIKSDKEINDNQIIEYGNLKEEKEKLLEEEKNKLEEMIKDPHNLIPLTEGEIVSNLSKYDRRVLDNIGSAIVTPIFIQQNKISDIKEEIDCMRMVLNECDNHRDKYNDLIEYFENVNFDEFILLQSYIEQEFGIFASKITYSHSESNIWNKNILKRDIYDIGAKQYSLKYIREIEKPSKGVK